MTESLRELTDACVHCGFCLPSCPTYQLTGEEAHSPRGRIHLLRQMLDGDATPDEIAGPIDTCLGCLACVPACPSGVQYEQIIEAGREVVVNARPLRDRAARKALFQVLPYPRRLSASTLPLRAVPALAKIDPLFEAASSLAPTRGDQPPARQLPRRIPARGPRRAVVGLLTGCAQSVFFRHVTAATARVLAMEGCDVAVPRGQGCCGALSMHAGHAGQARRLARRVVAAFTRAGVDIVVTDVAGCGSAMKGYARLLADDPKWADAAAPTGRQGPGRDRVPGRTRAGDRTRCAADDGGLPRRVPPRAWSGHHGRAAKVAGRHSRSTCRRPRRRRPVLRIGRHVQLDATRDGGRTGRAQGARDHGDRRVGGRRGKPGMPAADRGFAAQARVTDSSTAHDRIRRCVAARRTTVTAGV